jgi:hypothetical protein
MKRSWHAGRDRRLIKLAGGLGNLRITTDGEYSLYFHERQTGFCGEGHLPPNIPGRPTSAVRRLVQAHLKGVI